jgi:hypothetical protein
MAEQWILKPGPGDADQGTYRAPQAVKIDPAQRVALIVGEKPAADDTASAHYASVQPEALQDPQSVGLHRQTRTRRIPIVFQLDQLDVAAITVERRRQGEPADAAADDQDTSDVIHVTPRRSRLSVQAARARH